MREDEAIVRPARKADLSELARLCVEHACFERATIVEDGLADRLRVAIFGARPRLWAWVLADVDGRARGYATATRAFSTWSGRIHLHMDCLYLEPDFRGGGHGGRLMDAVRSVARRSGLAEVQWQTPEWNERAIRFYERQGAVGAAKRRFTARV